MHSELQVTISAFKKLHHLVMLFSEQHVSSYQKDSARTVWKAFLCHETVPPHCCFQLQVQTIEGLNMGHRSPRKLLVSSHYLESGFTSVSVLS